MYTKIVDIPLKFNLFDFLVWFLNRGRRFLLKNLQANFAVFNFYLLTFFVDLLYDQQSLILVCLILYLIYLCLLFLLDYLNSL